MTAFSRHPIGPQRFLLIIGAVILTVSSCALAGWGLRLWRFDETETIQGIAEQTRIALPPSARNGYGFADGWNDTAAYYRFEMDAADLPVLLANTHQYGPTDPRTFPAEAGPKWRGEHLWWQPLALWQPTTASRFLARETQFQHRRVHQWLLIDMTNPQTYRVYIYYDNFSFDYRRPDITQASRAKPLAENGSASITQSTVHWDTCSQPETAYSPVYSAIASAHLIVLDRCAERIVPPNTPMQPTAARARSLVF